MSTPIEAVIDEIVAVSASVAPWAPPLTRDQAADLLASYARHALGLSKDLPAGSTELFPRAYRPKRVAALGLGPVYATPAPVKVAPVPSIVPLAAPIAAQTPPPLPVKAVEAPPAPPESPPTADLDPVEVVEVDPSDVSPLDLLPMWASLPGSAPLAHSPVIESSVFDLICAHYDARTSISVHALRERRPAHRGASLNPLSGLANGFVAVVCEPDACPVFRFDTYTTRIGRFRGGNGENLEVHFILDFDAAQILDASNRNYDVEREALLDYEIAEQARLADIRQKRRQASTEALLANLDNPRRG